VVTPVLHPSQRIDNDTPSITGPDVANYSAHSAHGTADNSGIQQIDCNLHKRHIDSCVSKDSTSYLLMKSPDCVASANSGKTDMTCLTTCSNVLTDHRSPRCRVKLE